MIYLNDEGMKCNRGLEEIQSVLVNIILNVS
jgi:hypothetical protein